MNQATEDQIEDRARAVGWAPKEEFRGDPDKWVEANVFLERADKDMGLLKSNNEKLHETVGVLRDEISEMKSTFSSFKDYHQESVETAKKQGYEKARADLVRRQKAAVEDGDSAAFDRLEADKQKLDDDYHKPPPATESKPQVNGDFAGWARDNSWYGDDPIMRADADALGQFVQSRYPGLQGRAFFDKVTEEIKLRHPQKFNNVNRDAPATVTEGGEAPKRRQAKNYTNLPSDAKAACDKYVKQGLMTQEQYVNEYDWG